MCHFTCLHILHNLLHMTLLFPNNCVTVILKQCLCSGNVHTIKLFTDRWVHQQKNGTHFSLFIFRLTRLLETN